MDRELVLRAQDGNEEAFGMLAAGIGDRLYATAHHILRDIGRAEDATQQAIIDIWKQLPRLNDPDHFEAWAYRILVRSAYAEARRARRWGVGPIAIARSPTAGPDPAEAIADRDELERGFVRLSLDHRAVIVLKHYVGLSNDEIAQVLGVPEGTVRSRLYNALQTLRGSLEADARTMAAEGRS